MNKKFKTLVINNNTKYCEYYGYVEEHGWITSEHPIMYFDTNITIEDVIKRFSNINNNNIELVTIELNILKQTKDE